MVPQTMIQSTDKAKVRFGAVLVSEVRAVLKVSVLFITFPMFWALYDQQVSGFDEHICNIQAIV